jgi:hypothetical protein
MGMVRQKTCSRCGATFGCGLGAAGDGRGCWCEALPPLRTRLGGADCLCLSCLEATIQSQQAVANDAG